VALAKHLFLVDAVVPTASEKESFFDFDAMGTIASTGFASASVEKPYRNTNHRLGEMLQMPFYWNMQTKLFHFVLLCELCVLCVSLRSRSAAVLGLI